MKPFVLLATRPEEDLANEEYQAFMRFSGLTPDQLIRVRLEQGPMPDFDLEQVSGFIIGGSPFTSSTPDKDKTPLQRRAEGEMAALLDKLVPMDFPFFGACYGVGTLGGHEGAVIDDTYAEEISAPVITLTDAGRRDPVLRGVPQSFQAYVGHTESCAVLPGKATLLATSDSCPVQMFKIGDNMYATQFHPELDFEGLAGRVYAYQDHGYYPPDEQQRIIDTAQAADVTASHLPLKRFAQLYARP